MRMRDSAAHAAAVLLVGRFVQSPIPNTLPIFSDSKNRIFSHCRVKIIVVGVVRKNICTVISTINN